MSNKKPLAKVFHFDLYGKREDKYNFLNKNSLESIEWTELPNTAPNYFMVQKDFEAEKSYKKGFAINELFALSSVGIVTGKDALYVDDNKKKLLERIEEYYGQADEKLVKKIAYRPFDIRYLYNNIKLIERNRFRVMKHFIAGENVGLVTVRRIKTGKNIGFFITNKIGDDTLSGMSSSCICPLYIYPQTTNQKTIDQSTKRTPNLNPKIVKELAKKLKLKFVTEKQDTQGEFAPIDILDYIYAVLHSPSYREKYKEFLKIDFPRVPYPKDQTTFWQLVKLGGEIRQLHLLESPKVEAYITTYPKDGNNTITTKISKKDWQITSNKGTCPLGRIWINEDQYFDNIPLVAWEFYIGGYQPAQKWLKDRKEKTLTYEDINHYQKIIVALTETDRVMREVDGIEIG